MKKILFVILICSAILFVPFSSYAEQNVKEKPDMEQLLSLAKDADMFVDMFVYEFGMHTHESGTKYKEFALQKGYIDEDTFNETAYLDLGDLCGDAYKGVKATFYLYAEEYDSLEKWQEEIHRYFLSDYLGLLEPEEGGEFPLHVVEHDGRTWGTGVGMGADLNAIWETANLVKYAENTAVIHVKSFDEYGEVESDGLESIEFVKTENGWKISGGTYFWNAYGGVYEKVPPAQTGDASVVSIIAVSISVLALGAVVYRRKRTI